MREDYIYSRMSEFFTMLSLTRYLLVSLLLGICPISYGADTTLRVAVIGGLDMSGIWTRLEAAAEAALGLEITTVLTAPKEKVVPAFERGEVDFLLIHGGDETFALEALGYASALRTWGYSEFVFVGPVQDPAGIAQAATGTEALQKIQASGQPIISFRDAGSYQVLRRLLDQAGLVPRQLQLLPDAVNKAQQILRQAEREQAYVIVGHMPVAFGRMPADSVRVLFSGDPAMRRAYVAVTPGPRHSASAAARVNADELTEFLLSPEGQQLLREPEVDGEERAQWIFPRAAAAGMLQFP